MLAGHRIQPAESVRAQLENTFCNHFHYEKSFTNIAHRKTNRWLTDSLFLTFENWKKARKFQDFFV